jgi:glycerol-1-phosphatase
MTYRTSPDGSERRLDSAYDTALLDLDGVVYAGGEAIAHAVDSLREARGRGMRLAYVTNNAARTPRTVAEHLTRLGVPATDDEIVTSAQAVARLIAERVPAGAKVLAVGGEGLWEALRERGLEPVESAGEGLAAAVQGYSPQLRWVQLAEMAYAVNAGVPWFASNTDLTIPSARGIAPGNGAAVEAVRIATGGTPVVAGKPQPPMHRESILRTGAKRPLVVGDRLDTDIEGAFAGGVDSLLVLTGVTTPAELLAAEPRHRPSYVGADLRDLLRAHPEVEALGGGSADPADPAGAPGEGSGHGSGRARGDAAGRGFTCRGWTASAGPERLELAGAGDPLDGLRALCAAAWTAAGDSGCALDSAGALGRLGL